MDPLIAAAARTLGALALRGIAMAQIGTSWARRPLLRRAPSARNTPSPARCVVAETEIALASRDLGWSAKALEAARAALEQRGDRVNSAHARLLEVSRLSS